MKEPVISICRQSRTCGILDGFTFVRDFLPYTDEAQAQSEAEQWVKDHSTPETKPTRIVYPMIRKMKFN